MKMLMYFYYHQDQLVTRQNLIEEVWCSNYISDEAINIGVSRLRKLLTGKREDFIATIRGKGYQFRLNPEVTFEVKNTNPPKTEIAQEPPAPTPTTNIRNRLTSPWLMGLVGLLALLVVMLWLFNKPPTTSDSLPLKFPLPIELNVSVLDMAEPGYQQSLLGSLKNQLRQSQKLKLNDTAANRYVIAIDVTDIAKSSNIRVSISNKALALHYSTNLGFDQSAQLKEIAAELSAYIRLMLIHDKKHHDLLDAYNPLSYREIEQLVKARMYTYWGSDESFSYAFDVVSNLSKKYPDMPQLNGLMSKLFDMNITHDDSDIITQNNLALNKAKAALATDPSNFDALTSAFSYHRDQAQLRDKAIEYAQALQYHHREHPKGWRNQLLLMIDSATPCNDIQDFVRSVPKGVFKPLRLKVIERILKSCINEMPGQAIYDQLSFQPNSKKDKAILNNLVLFKVQHDQQWLPQNQSKYGLTGPMYNTIHLIFSLKKEDRINADAYLQKIEQNQNGYWLWYAQLYLSLYAESQQGASHKEKQLWQDAYYQILQRDSEIFFAAMLSKMGSTVRRERMHQYLMERPYFTISITNRKESIAKMIILHLSGQIEKSQKIASLLYQQLENNYQTSPASFRFWQLGSFHLIAKMYCGQPCNTSKQTSAEYFEKMFSRHHIWWQDDLILMQHILKPWPQTSLVQSYLQKISDDLDRVQLAQGIR